MPVPVEPEDVTLTVAVRHTPRRHRDGWLEYQRRDPETGAEWWERVRPLAEVEIAMFGRDHEF